METSQPFAGKRFLLIGGFGLIGSTTARYLLSKGADVTIVNDVPIKNGFNHIHDESQEKPYEFILGDVRERSFIDLVVRDKDYIFNFAAQVNHNVSLENPLLDNELNCIGHINVLMACKKYNPSAKLVYPGSRLQYGRIRKLPVAEDHPREPLSFYALHKNTAEQYYQTFSEHYGLRTTCFRITNPYGPRSQMLNSGHNLVNWFIRKAMDNEPITIFGTGEQIRDYIFVGDLVEGMVSAAVQNETDGKIYNIGSGKPTKFIEMAKAIIDVVGQGSIVHVPWPKDYDHFETGDFYADIRKIEQDVQWRPTVSLQEGVQKTVAYYSKFRQYYW